MEHVELKAIKNVFILGATGGIGRAIVEYLLENNSSLVIHAPTRTALENHPRIKNKVMDEISEKSLNDFLNDDPGLKFEFVINTIGFLENDLGGPEKSLRDITEEKLLESFRVNSILTPLLAKVVRTHISEEGFAFVALSAMVGSIGENELGGWYGYRASKAALNSFIKSIAIEWRRTHKKSLVLAIHPGTTQTRLSDKFSTNVKHKIHTPRESAENICHQIFKTSYGQTGSFLNWDGRIIKW